MRSTLLGSAFVLGTFALTIGCATNDPAPPPRGGDAPGAPRIEIGQPAAAIVYTSLDGGREIWAALEDGSRAPVRLSRSGVVASFGAKLPGRRVLLVSHAADGTLASLEIVGVDGAGRQDLGTLDVGRYTSVIGAKTDGDVVALELGRADEPVKSDVVVARAGTIPAVVATSATLVAIAGERVAFKSAGGLASAKLDGSARLDLGAGDGQDHVMDVRGDRVLVTLHDTGLGDVRVVHLDGSSRIDLGAAEVDDRAFAFAGDDHVVVARGAEGARRLFAVGIDGGGSEVALSPEGTSATPLTITADEVLFGDAQGALHATSLIGGAPRLLDGQAGTSIHFGKVSGDRVFFTGGASGGALRAAKLDGTGAVTLVDELTWLPFFSARTPANRVVFYRALVGQLEGGHLFTVDLDGGDLEPVGEDVVNRDGTAFGQLPADQDFEVVTPSGRIILEAEFEGVASHLLVTPGSRDARRLADQTNVKFAALVTD